VNKIYKSTSNKKKDIGCKIFNSKTFVIEIIEMNTMTKNSVICSNQKREKALMKNNINKKNKG
jgi:hypothetical protein